MNALHGNRYISGRSIFLGLAKVLFLAALPVISAAPVRLYVLDDDPDLQSEPITGATLWLYLIIAACLVLGGGAFAGLTIALMGQVSPLAIVQWLRLHLANPNPLRMRSISR